MGAVISRHVNQIGCGMVVDWKLELENIFPIQFLQSITDAATLN